MPELTHEEITNLEYDKGERHIEEEIDSRSSISDIDTELLAEYKNIVNTKLSDINVLEARGLLIDGELTLAGILLFSKNPLKFYPNCRLRFLRYEGTEAKTGERLNITKDINIDGPIPRIIKEAKNVLSAQLRDFQRLASNGKFTLVPEYPEFAWFEGIVNALTHRDYSQRGDHIRVIMYDDRLEILSPGKLPNVVDLKNMKYTRYSRNPVIARVLSEFGWVKELNEGVKRIYEEMEKYFLDAPEYSEPNDNSVLLKLKNNYIMREIRGSEHMQKALTEELWKGLSNEEKKIIQYVFKESKITTSIASSCINRSTGYTRKLLNRLIELEILVWHGSSKKDPTQYYQLNLERLK
ncbi:MAG: ATP-binding protein [Candidatus Cloacimonadales bacterium]|nr:ATP-binding protein [Candidatus Cloacimonadales bacterium]